MLKKMRYLQKLLLLLRLFLHYFDLLQHWLPLLLLNQLV
jgi:hypothetical protein